MDIFELHAFVLSSTNNGLSISSAYAGDSLKIKKKLKKKTQPDIFSLQFFFGGGGVLLVLMEVKWGDVLLSGWFVFCGAILSGTSTTT